MREASFGRTLAMYLLSSWEISQGKIPSPLFHFIRLVKLLACERGKSSRYSGTIKQATFHALNFFFKKKERQRGLRDLRAWWRYICSTLRWHQNHQMQIRPHRTDWTATGYHSSSCNKGNEAIIIPRTPRKQTHLLDFHHPMVQQKY